MQPLYFAPPAPPGGGSSGPGPCFPNPCVPLDEGVSLLFASGVAFAVYFLLKKEIKVLIKYTKLYVMSLVKG